MPNQTNLLDILLEEKQMKLKGGLYHQSQIKLCYNSNRIEGSRLSEEQTRHIFETNTLDATPGEAADVDDIIETVNHFAAFDYMLDHASQPLTEEIIKELHRILKSSTSDSRKSWFQVGGYKTRPNVVGDRETTPPGDVAAQVGKLLAWYGQEENASFADIVEFHARFETIHPFQDGNGRVGRLVMFKECLRNRITPFIIGHEHKLFYYRGLSEYGSEPGYLMDTCLSAQDAYGVMADYFFPGLLNTMP